MTTRTDLRRVVRWVVYLTVGLTVMSMTGCVLLGEDPDDISALLKDKERVPGLNLTKYARVSFSDSLDESEDETMYVFANWYGFKKSAINDGVIQALTPDISETVSVAWSSDTQDPSEGNSQWIVYEFPSAVKVRRVTIYGRADTMPNYGDPGRNFPQDFEIYVTNVDPTMFVHGNWEFVSSQKIYEYQAPARVAPTVANPGRVHDMTQLNNQGRFFVMRITRNTGDYTQIGELEVYGDPLGQ